MSAALLFATGKATVAASLYVALGLGTLWGTEPEAGKPVARKAPAQGARATRPVAVPPVVRVVRLTNDSLAGQPFGDEPTVQELLRAGGKVVGRKPCRNLYETGQVDTVLLVRHQGNIFEFYRTPEKDLLRDALVVNFEPAYGRRLRTRLASAHRPAASTIDKVRIGDSERTNYVSVVYQSGRLSTVHVEPYLE